MTYNVFGGTLSLTQSINQSTYFTYISVTFSHINGFPQFPVSEVLRIKEQQVLVQSIVDKHGQLPYDFPVQLFDNLQFYNFREALLCSCICC